MKKYRPYLTLTQLQHILERIEDYPTKRYLSRFIADIDEGFINEAINPRTLEEKLEIVKEPMTAYEKEQEQRFLEGQMSYEETVQWYVKGGFDVETARNIAMKPEPL